jgi:hypothetical protein
MRHERQLRAQVAGSDVAVRAECLAVHQGELGPGRPQLAQARPAVDVLPEVGDAGAAGQPGHATGGDLRGAAHRWRRRPDELPVTQLRRPHRLPAVPALQPAPVLGLPRDEVGGGDVRGPALPGRVRAGDGGAAVRMIDVQLGQERGALSPLVVRPYDADLAAEPAVGQQRSELVRSLGQQAGDVVGLDLQPAAVLGEPRGQLEITDPAAAEERLVQAVRGRVEPGPCHWLADTERGAQLVGRASGHGRDAGLGRADPAGRPVRRLQQPGLERRRP